MLAREALVPVDLARVDDAFVAVLRLAVERLAVDRLAAVLRPPLDFFAAPLREADEPELVPALASIDHLPDITR